MSALKSTTNGARVLTAAATPALAVINEGKNPRDLIFKVVQEELAKERAKHDAEIARLEAQIAELKVTSLTALDNYKAEQLRKEKEAHVTFVKKLGQGVRDTLIKIVVVWLFFMLFEQSTKNLGPEMKQQIQDYKDVLSGLFEALFTPAFQSGGYAVTETVIIEGQKIVVPFATEAHRDLFHELINQRGGTRRRRRYRNRTRLVRRLRRDRPPCWTV